MGTFLSIPYKLQENINSLPGNAFQVYLLFLRCITFKPKTRIPINGTEVFEYTYTKAKQHGYNKSKSQFIQGIKDLIMNRYVLIVSKGHFQGKAGQRKPNRYRLLIF